jgi:glycosyltransferase involved in cell wall biosynthesis
MTSHERTTSPAAMHDPLVTVVIAVKAPPPSQLLRCLASFAALEAAHRLQVLLVVSGPPPVLPDDSAAPYAALDCVQTPPRGVYAAFNVGIERAAGRYALFFGVDDIALPGMDAALAEIARRDYDLFAAACYMQGKGALTPSANRRSLIRANWCQQGIFYATERLRRQRFDTRYTTQADHKLNIDLVSDPSTRLGLQREPVAYFSAGGLSTQRHDLAFIRDFPAIVGAAYGRPTGWYWSWRQRLSILLYGPLEARYSNAPR